MLLDVSEYDRALTDFSYGVRFSGGSPTQLNNYAAALHRLNRFEESLVFLDLSIDLDPEFPYAYHGRANVYYAQGLYEESLPDFTKSIELNPEEPVFVYERGDAYFFLGRYEEALADYLAANALDRRNSDYVDAGIRTMYTLLVEQVKDGSYRPPKEGLEMLDRYAALCAQEKLTLYTDLLTNNEGIPLYVLQSGVGLAMFTSNVPDRELVYLLSFDDPAALDEGDFQLLCDNFFRAVNPGATDSTVEQIESILGLTATGGLPEGVGAASFRQDKWQYDRMEYEGKLLLVAYSLPWYEDEALVSQEHVYTTETLQGILEAFRKYAVEYSLPIPNLKGAVDYDQSEEGLPIRWRQLLTGLYWGEQFDDSDGSFVEFRLTISKNSPQYENADLWIGAAMRAIDGEMTAEDAKDYYQAFLSTKYDLEDYEGGEAASTLTLHGRLYLLVFSGDHLTLYTFGNIPEDL